MVDINELEQGYLETVKEEAQDYSDAQFKTIVSLQKKLSKLEEENASLKLMLESNLPTIGFTTEDLVSGISNEQLICETQILLLKQRAINGELTLEEARKFEVYTKILDGIKLKGNPRDNFNVSKISSEELLSLVESNGSN